MGTALGRRPLFWAACALSAGIFLAGRWPVTAVAAYTAAALLAVKFLIERRFLALFLVLFFPSGVLAASLAHRAGPADLLRHAPSAEVFVGGRVVSEPEWKTGVSGSRRTAFTLEAKRFWSGPGAPPEVVSGRTRVYLRDPAESPVFGDELVVRGDLELPKGRRNPGGFNQRAWLERGGVRTILFGKKDCVQLLRRDRGNPVLAAAARTRRFLSEALAARFPGQNAALLRALLLGERSGLDQDSKDLFFKTGTVHILAVSGFNVGFLALCVFLVLRLVPVGRNVTTVLSLAAVWGYCFLVGWQAPVVRATLMLTLFAASQLLGRRADPLNTLGFAALGILAFRPLELFDAGFELSFLAVLAIVVFVPRFLEAGPLAPPGEPIRLRDRAGRYGAELFWVSFVCLFATLPLTARIFHIVTPVALLANLAVVPLAGFLFVAGLLFLTVCAGPAALLAPLAGVIVLTIRALLKALRTVEALPGASIAVGEPTVVFCIVLAGGLALLAFHPRIRGRWTRAAAVVLFTADLFLGRALLAAVLPRPLEVTVLDVGQGDSIFVRFPGGGTLLVDAGRGFPADDGHYVVAPFLKARGVSALDLLVATHPPADPIGGMPSVLRELDVRNVAAPESPCSGRLCAELGRLVTAEGASRSVLARGDRIAGFGKDISIDVLGPPPGPEPYPDVNDRSAVLRLRYGRNVFLLTGDATTPALADLPDPGPADVLKVPHHGSALGQAGKAFFERVRPRFSVISVGERNPFGHPRPGTLFKLASIPNNLIFRTDEYGSVTFLSDGRSVELAA